MSPHSWQSSRPSQSERLILIEITRGQAIGEGLSAHLFSIHGYGSDRCNAAKRVCHLQINASFFSHKEHNLPRILWRGRWIRIILSSVSRIREPSMVARFLAQAEFCWRSLWCLLEQDTTNSNLKKQNFFPIVPKAGKSKVKMPTDCVSGENPLVGCRLLVSSCIFTWW